jgi:hypothetical protein
MAIIYSYPLNDDIKPLDELVGTTEKTINGQLKTVTRNFLLQDLAEFFIVDGGLQKEITLTTDNSTGAATLNQVTGILNIPRYDLGSITSVSAIAPITSTGGTTPVISTSMSTNKLIGRYSTGTGIFEEITLGTGLSFAGNVLNSTATITPAALTKVDDTNVILTLGGSPSNALLQGVSLTLGWAGTLEDSRITSSSNWNTAYNNRITSLTTTGSGAATLVSNTLNIPTIGVVSATESGIVNNTSLQELGGVDKKINSVRIGQGNVINGFNTAVGIDVLKVSIKTTGITGSFNSGFGESALSSNTTGYQNDAFGASALRSNTTGFLNTSIGNATLVSNTTGIRNTAIGAGALYYNTTGNRNVAVGLGASQNATTGSYNVSLGYQAGSNNRVGNTNIQIGYNFNISAGLNGGNNNTFISNDLTNLGIITGNNNVILGSPSGLASTLSNYIILADNSGTIRFQTTDTGLTTVPGQTNILINADTTGKAVVTKEYLTNVVGSQNLQQVTNLGATTTNSITANSFIKDGGFDFQFLKADGSVDNNTYLTSADLPSTLDLYATTSPDPVIAGYTALVRNIADSRYNTTAVNVPTPTITGTLASPTFCGAVISDPSILLGNPGIFNFSVIGKIRRAGGSTSSGADFFYGIYKRDLAGVETLIANSAPVVVPANGGIYVEYISIALWNNGIFLSTDRVVLKFYGVKTGEGSGATYEFQFGGSDPVRGTAAISSAIIPNIYLKDLADVEKTPALNNEVLYWNDSASLWEHSLVENLVPDASATQKGLVTTGDQTFAGAKTFTSTINATSDNDYAISAISTNSDGLSAETTNGNGVVGVSVNGIGGVFMTTNNANIAEFKTNFVTKVAIQNNGKITATAGTASTDVVVKSQLDTKQDTITLSAIGAVPNANAATLTGSVLSLEPASDSFGGVVTVATQTFAGNKTFRDQTILGAGIIGTPTYGLAPQATVGSTTGGVFDIRNTNTDIIAGNTIGTLQFSAKDDNSVAYANAQIKAITQNGIGTGSSGKTDLIFYTSNGSTSTERVKMNDLGLVINSEVIQTIASFDANKSIKSLSTTTYPSLTELSYVKGVTSSVQTQLNGKQPINANLTALAGLTHPGGVPFVRMFSSGVFILDTSNYLTSVGISNLTATGTPSATTYLRGDNTWASFSAAPQNAYTILANNTNASAVPTEQVFKAVAEQVYTPTPVWTVTGTAPSGTTDHSYQWSQIGNTVNVRLNLAFASTGSGVTAVSCPLPADMPTPKSPSGFTTANANLYYGSGLMTNTRNSAPTTAPVFTSIRRNSNNNGYEFFMSRASNAPAYVYISIQYFTA